MTLSFRTNKENYGMLSISMHWLMLILIVVTYAMMDLKSMYPKGSPPREIMAFLHYSFGLTIFVLVWIRIWGRTLGAAPAVVPEMPPAQALVAKLMHLALYILMIGLPILGWLTLSAKGTPVPFWGTELPALIEMNKDAARSYKWAHENLATLGYFLIGLHAAAALFHHHVKRDNTLLLMMPKIR